MAAPEVQVITGNKQPRRRQYGDRQRATVLAVLEAQDGNIAATVRITGVPYKTISDWRDSLSNDPEIASYREESKQSLSLKLENLAHKLVDAAPKKIRKASLAQVATAFDLSIKNLQLINGQPTSITEERSFDSRQVLVLMREVIGEAGQDEPKALTPASDTDLMT